MSNIANIFVYGTLKPGESNYQRYCAKQVLLAQKVVARGQLFALPMGYPAMTLGNNKVHGYLLSFPNADILSDLDCLEDYHPHRPTEQNEYNRQLINIDNSVTLGTAWAYLMTKKQVELAQGVLIPDGWWSGCGLKI